MIAIVYGVVSYLVFLASFLYAVGFVGNWIVPKTIDSGVAGGTGEALVVDALLLGLFAVQHSVMARPAFKRLWTRIISESIERSTYVLSSSLVLLLLFWQWKPLPQTVWSTSGVARDLLLGGNVLGWTIVLLSTFMLSHFELFGLRQVWLAASKRAASSPTVERAWLYRFVRHPIMLGFLIAFWATPNMTLGHLVFTVACTGYIFVGVRLEERDLEASLGEQYRSYQQEVRMLVPLPRRRSRRA